MNQLTTAQNIANDFTALGNYIGFCTGPPGSGSTVLNEATGGSPAYVRKATTWTANSNGSSTGSQVTVNLPAGTYPYAILCSASSGNNMVDWCILSTPIMLSTQGPITFTPAAAVV